MRLSLYILSVLILILVSLNIGVREFSFSALLSLEEDSLRTFMLSRLPRTMALILAGVGMSISGLIMQQISLNKFVSPTTAGTLDAAKLGILTSLVLFPGAASFYKMGFSFVFTVAASLLFMLLIRRIQHKSLIYIPLIGIMFGNILAAIGTYFAYKQNIVQNMETWLIGDFSTVLQGNYELVYIAAPVVLITYIYANKLTLLGLGKEVSHTLGLNYNAMVLLGLLCVSLTVSAVMITAGAIPFLGLIVPNVVSMIYGDNLKQTLPITALMGAVFLLVSDIAGRLIIFPYEIPIGLTVGILGGITFLFLIVKRTRNA